MSQVPKLFPCLSWLKFPFFFLRSHLLCWQSSWKLCGVQKYQLTLIVHISDLISPEHEPYLSKIHSPRICDSFCEKQVTDCLGAWILKCLCVYTCAHTHCERIVSTQRPQEARGPQEGKHSCLLATKPVTSGLTPHLWFSWVPSRWS